MASTGGEAQKIPFAATLGAMVVGIGYGRPVGEIVGGGRRWSSVVVVGWMVGLRKKEEFHHYQF